MGKRIKLSNGRRLVDDVIHMANKMPLAGLAGDFDAGMVAEFRRKTRPKICWNVLYMKAYASVCRQDPQLRRSYASFPWGHLYEHDSNVCMMTISREYLGEERLFFARFNNPDMQTLIELQKQYDHYRKAPVKEIKQFRHQIRFAKAPWFVRRFAWWMLFNVWPEKRASHMGTFGMSFSGYKGSYGAKHLGPNTTTLGVDPFPRKGVGRIVLTFDHRVIDGTPVAKTIQKLQHIMKTAIKVELAEMIGVNPATGEPLTDDEMVKLKKQIRARRIEANQRKAIGNQTNTKPAIGNSKAA
ncbi:MAG: hypothetical protein AB8B55_22495 [Mariniblastus sp.]